MFFWLVFPACCLFFFFFWLTTAWSAVVLCLVPVGHQTFTPLLFTKTVTTHTGKIFSSLQFAFVSFFVETLQFHHITSPLVQNLFKNECGEQRKGLDVCRPQHSQCAQIVLSSCLLSGSDGLVSQWLQDQNTRWHRGPRWASTTPVTSNVAANPSPGWYNHLALHSLLTATAAQFHLIAMNPAWVASSDLTTHKVAAEWRKQRPSFGSQPRPQGLRLLLN